MIHFFPKFSPDAENTPFGVALRATGAQTRVFSVFLQQHYRHRYELLLRFYPVLLWRSFAAARRSLFADPPPHAVVVSSDVEAVVFGLMRRLPGAARACIILMPFIFTSRQSPAANRMRLFYYRAVMRQVSLAICHSALEVGTYQRLFAQCGTQFSFVRWGTDVPSIPDIEASQHDATPAALPVIAAAGKSGRDYRTLVAAAEGLPCRLVIVCSDESVLAGVVDGPSLTVLRRSFGLDYLWQMLHADIVVVPLAATDISAGQMVFIQSMALGRPLVVTRSATVTDYLVHGETALLVPHSDVAAMRAAIQSLLSDPAKAARLGANAQSRYRNELSGLAHLKAVVDTVTRHIAL